jgi:folate-dependent phosphoribosylglycinamide formyltransferase PurN
MFAGQGESSRLMYNGIKDSFDITKVIFDKPVPTIQFLSRRLKRLGFSTVFGQILFMIYNRIWLINKARKRIDEIKREKKLNSENIDESIIYVDSINSEAIIDIVKEHRPDVVLVNGTRIIKKKIINAIDVPLVNTHMGITPKYRGVHGGYWALTENDLVHCGVTVHLVDSGIDTGGVLYQSIIKISNRDNFNTYPYLQMAAAIPLMKKAIIDVANNKYMIKKVDLPSRIWSHPTIIQYFKYRLFHGVK